MSDLSQRDQVAFEITTTSTPLDRQLFLMKDYLTAHLLSTFSLPQNSGSGSQAPLSITIDIAAAGREEERGAERWLSDLIYPIRLARSEILLGPLYQPAQGGPCPLCLERRWLRTLPREEQLMLRGPALIPCALDSLCSIVEMTLLQSTSATRTEKRQGQGWLYTLSLTSLQLTRHLLLADSLCPHCARPAQDTPEAASIALSSREKRQITDRRLLHATEYDLPVEGLVDPVCGIFGAEITTAYHDTLTASVYGTLPALHRPGATETAWGGHGYSYASSRSQGLLEALERYAAQETRAKKTAVHDSYINIEADALNPLACGLYTDECYRALSPRYQPFDPARKMPWVWGYSFRAARPLLVPEQLVYYMSRREGVPLFVQESSNGCAAGSCLEEAILHGLLELIERDAFLLTWYARLAPPRIDPWSCRNQQTLATLARIERLGYQIHLFDTRLDIRIPSVTALALLREDAPGKLALAAGAALDPEEAISSALGEVAAALPDFARRLENERERVQALAHDFTRVSSIDDHALLYGLPEMAAQADFLFQNPRSGSLAEIYQRWMEEAPQSLDLRDDVTYCIDHILKLNMDVVVVEQTPPEQRAIGLTTVKVIVPGLLPIDFGWGRERALTLPRLRSVPRTVGFQKSDFDPAEANRTPHPFP